MSSLNKRFSNLIQQDVFLISTFLDPKFGLDSFDKEKKKIVTSRAISLMKQHDTLALVEQKINNLNSQIIDQVETGNKPIKLNEKRKSNYVFHRQSVSDANKKDDKNLEEEFNDYIRIICDENFECSCPLIFWKTHESRFKKLSNLAKKYLGVPASSAAVERMFSIAGHVFNTKRRKMGLNLFSTLVFLKLNEHFLNLSKRF